MNIRLFLLPITLGVFLFAAPGALGDTFDVNSEKALVFFAVQPNEFDMLINFGAVNTRTNSIDLKRGFPLIIGQGTVLFGPHTADYQTEGSRTASFQQKKVKPGAYIILSANGGPKKGKASLSCFDENTKVFSVEAGKIYLITLPNARPLNNIKDVRMNWEIDPQLSAAELAEIFENYVEANPSFSFDTTVEALPFRRARFDYRLKFNSCHPSKEKTFEYLME
jgi:hypothetical protein